MTEIKLNCPMPLHYQHIVMAHGGGGRLMQQLLDDVVQPIFNNPILAQKNDSAILPINSANIAFTTDSYVVKPLFFPGGDIGKLAVCGTLNDLAMSGAKPLYLTCSLILEEGFAIKDLRRLLTSMQATASAAGVSIVTGDTKVVEHGKADGVYINTAGVGILETKQTINAQAIRPDDVIIINSDLGRHGLAVMLERDGFDFTHNIQSDCADVSGLVNDLLQANVAIHCLRDLTRGGLASALIELATSAKVHMEIKQVDLPIHDDVQSLCELLGFDPLYIANEGCFALIVPENNAEQALRIMRQHSLGRQANIIGVVKQTVERGMLTLKTEFGMNRVLDLLSGEQLPRIC
ncbi:MAG: hydrogenase expression/formation protein HypE [Methyloprofundus sp.]|nr:hydrogenase expression/formation protein HypE [Methyloprofundus sp.]MBW6453366.1 hydrogenase expression/formation protein HypE [Methyloprofundus sp.]